MLHASGNQRGPHVPVELGHLDLVQVAVDPVQFPCDPVHGQALRGGQAVLHHHLDPRHPWNNDMNITTRRGSSKCIQEAAVVGVSSKCWEEKPILKAEEETQRLLREPI